MSPLPILCASVANQLTPRVNEPEQRFTTNDILIVLSAALGVAVVLVIWAAFFRKRPKDEEYEYPNSSRSHSESHSSGEHGERRRRRKRRRKRDHRPRNPTLQQTGGLPPPRPEDQPPPH